MSQQSFDLTPGQNIVNYNLHFAPLSAVVDNMTPYWVRLPDAGRYIAPYSTGGSVPLINAMGGTVLWEAPAIAGIAQIPFIADAGVLHITFVDEVLSYTPPAPIPDIAFNNSIAFTWNVGTTLVETTPFLAIGTRIDNPSGMAYTISGTGLIIPPWTLGWTIDILPPYNTITIAPIANPSGQSNVARGGPLTLTSYSGKIGISPGISQTPQSNVYNITGVAIPSISGVTSIFLLDGISAGIKARLNSLTFVNPGVAQIYSIYAVTPGTLIQNIATTPTITEQDPDSPVFPGTIYVPTSSTPATPYKTQVVSTGDGVTSGSLVLPNTINNGDLLYLAIMHRGTANTGLVTPPANFTNIGELQIDTVSRIAIWRKVGATSDRGVTVTWGWGANTRTYIAGLLLYGNVTHLNSGTGTTGTTLAMSFGNLAGTTNQLTVEIGGWRDSAAQPTAGAGVTTRINQVFSGASFKTGLFFADYWAASNTNPFVPTATTGTGLIAWGTNTVSFVLTPAFSFTTVSLLGQTASIPTGTTTKVDVKGSIAEIIGSSVQAIGITEPANTAMTISAEIEIV